MRSRPIGDGLQEHELVSPKFINAGSTWNFLLRVQVLEVAVTEPDEGQEGFECAAMSLEDLHSLVGTHELARLGVTDILQLPPPFPETDAAEGPDCPCKGDHDVCC